jgi:hypothetical protein
LVLFTGCVPAEAPYRFTAPVLSGVAAAELSPAGKPRSSSRSKAGRLSRRPEPLVVSSIPNSPALGKGEDLATFLRIQVGTRDKKRNHVQFVIGTLRALGLGVDPIAAMKDGPAFVDYASAHHAKTGEERPRLGDVVVFDDVVKRDDASLLGVVISTDNQGTTEFLYLARGVVRRGYVNPGHPARPRDDAGRALNTFIRHSDGKDPIGTRFLAGQLFSTFVATAKLSQSTYASVVSRSQE